jgi:hypothetical protein
VASVVQVPTSRLSGSNLAGSIAALLALAFVVVMPASPGRM